MSLSNAMRVSATGMTAERFRMDVISLNIAGANTVRVIDPATGRTKTEAYLRRDVVLSGDTNGVQIRETRKDTSPLRPVFEPGNPMADRDGYVWYSNVKPVQEMIDMMGASRAYEANVAAFNAAKGMVRAALSIGKV